MSCVFLISQVLFRQFFFFGGRKIGRNFERVFVLCSLCRITQKNFSPNSPQFITLRPANEMSKFDLRELLRLKGIFIEKGPFFTVEGPRSEKKIARPPNFPVDPGPRLTPPPSLGRPPSWDFQYKPSPSPFLGHSGKALGREKQKP